MSEFTLARSLLGLKYIALTTFLAMIESRTSSKVL